MPSCDYGKEVKTFIMKYPDKIAHIFSPESWKNPIHQYAIDNGCEFETVLVDDAEGYKAILSTSYDEHCQLAI